MRVILLCPRRNRFWGLPPHRIQSLTLLEVLNAIDKDIIIEFNKEEKNKPIIVKTTEKKENIKYIIMPMIID